MAEKENNQNKINKSFINGKMEKYGITRKTIYSSLSIVACTAIIIVLSITQAYFDPSKLKEVSYWVDLMIQISLCIFGMIAGKQAGDDIAKNTPDGRYRVSLNSYSIVLKAVKDLGLYAYISDWLELYRERKLKEKIKMTLNDNGIKQLEVLDLDFKDLDKLLEPGFRKNWDNTPYRAKYWVEKEEKSYTDFVSYTKEQIEVIKFIKQGGVKVSYLPSTFFVSAFLESEKDEWESSAKASKKKGLYVGLNYAYKVLGMAMFSILLTGLQVMINSEDPTATASMWLTMISRIGTLFMSYIWGTFVGMNLVKIDNEYLDFKISILSLYIEEFKNGSYKIMTVEEKAKKAHEDREKKYQGTIAIVEGEGVREVK